MIGTLVVRALRESDVDALAGILSRAYGSAQSFDWRLRSYLRRTSVATFIAELDGAPAGMVVGNDYGSTAYVSQMAVDPPLHGRGIATILMDRLIAWVERRGFVAVELDATAPGAPLYARYGFVADGQTVVFVSGLRQSHQPSARLAGDADTAALLDLDRRAFGADRGDVLRLLVGAAGNTVVVAGPPGNVTGYAVAQAGADVLGPVVAADERTAAALVDSARAYLPIDHRAMLPSANAGAATIFTARDYRPLRSTTHMIRGTRPPARRDLLYARINLGQG